MGDVGVRSMQWTERGEVAGRIGTSAYLPRAALGRESIRGELALHIGNGKEV